MHAQAKRAIRAIRKTCRFDNKGLQPRHPQVSGSLSLCNIERLRLRLRLRAHGRGKLSTTAGPRPLHHEEASVGMGAPLKTFRDPFTSFATPPYPLPTCNPKFSQEGRTTGQQDVRTRDTSARFIRPLRQRPQRYCAP
jgi:hypothetical protein